MWTPPVSGGRDATVSQDVEDEVGQLVSNLEIIGRRYIGRKCVEDHVRDTDGRVLVHMTDEFIQTTLWFQILKVGKDCKFLGNDILANNEVFMYFPEWDDGQHALGNDLFMVDESMMEGRNPSLKPFIVIQPKEIK
jgi:translation initiation factor 6 (eIF-6)